MLVVNSLHILNVFNGNKLVTVIQASMSNPFLSIVADENFLIYVCTYVQRLGSSLGTTLRNATNATYMTVQAKRASQGFIVQAERTRGTSLN